MLQAPAAFARAKFFEATSFFPSFFVWASNHSQPSPSAAVQLQKQNHRLKKGRLFPAAFNYYYYYSCITNSLCFHTLRLLPCSFSAIAVGEFQRHIRPILRPNQVKKRLCINYQPGRTFCLKAAILTQGF